MHISEIADGFIKHPSEVLHVGQNVTVKVLGVDARKNKISLSLKTSENPQGLRVKTKGMPRRGANGNDAASSDMLKALQERFKKQ